MFWGVPANMLLEIAKSNGYMQQLDLDLDGAPILNISEEYLEYVNVNLDITHPNGFREKTLSSKDHQVFTIYREWLADNGYINKVTNYSNGDTVIKPFYANGVLFDVDERFPSAGALGGMLRVRNKINQVESIKF